MDRKNFLFGLVMLLPLSPLPVVAGGLGTANVLTDKMGRVTDGKPQPSEITGDPRENFLYGSIGGENEAAEAP